MSNLDRMLLVQCRSARLRDHGDSHGERLRSVYEDFWAQLARAKAEVAAQLLVATVAQPTHAPAPEYAGIHWRFN